MRILPGDTANELAGSTAASRMQFNAWYDGRVVAADIPVVAYTCAYDAAKNIVGTANLTVLDNTGVLAPWTISDTLGVGGSCIQTVLIHRNLYIPLAMQNIAGNDVEETWSLVGTPPQWVYGSGHISLQLQDTTIRLQGAQFMTQESVPAGATCLSEIRRLCTGFIDVVVDPAVVDKSVPASVVYQQDRLGAVMNLVNALKAEARTGPGGQLEVYLPTTTSAWEFYGGQEGGLITYTRSQRIQDFPNAAVSTSTDANGAPLYGYAVQTAGEGFFDGPHGRWPVFHGANLVNTQNSVSADAATTLANLQRTRTVEMPFTVAFHPGLDAGDCVTMDIPIIDGSVMAITGRIRSLTYSGGKYAPMTMQLVLQVPADTAKALSDAMHRVLKQGNL